MHPSKRMRSSNVAYSRPVLKSSFEISNAVASLLAQSRHYPNFSFEFMNIEKCSETKTLVELTGPKAWKLQDWLKKLDEPANMWPYSLMYDSLLRERDQFECLTYFFAYYYAILNFKDERDQHKYALMVRGSFSHYYTPEPTELPPLALKIHGILLTLRNIHKIGRPMKMKCPKFGKLPTEIKEIILLKVHSIEMKIRTDWKNSTNDWHSFKIDGSTLPINLNESPSSSLLPLRETNHKTKAHVDSFIQRKSLSFKNGRQMLKK